MTLEEAIKHCEEVTIRERNDYSLCPTNDCDGRNSCKVLKNGEGRGCIKCAEEHEQLAGWLTQLKQVQDIVDHWNDESSSFVSACNAFEDILHIFGKGVGDEDENSN